MRAVRPLRPSRRSVAVLASALAAGLASATAVAPPVAAATDGPPVIGSTVAQAGPTTGAVPIRIYGTGFLGTLSVKFGTVNATRFKVVDGGLITAVVPAAANGTGANNTSVDITVTDDQGVGVGRNDPVTGDNTGWYYTNATFTVSPSTGLVAGSAITATLNGYRPNTDMVLPELNPLMLYLEGGPDYPFGPPPYASVRTFPTTDAAGHFASATTLANPFNGWNGTAYDPNVACPVNQKTVNFLGVSAPASPARPVYAGKCMMATGQFGTGTLDTPINFTTDRTPAAPMLKLSTSTAVVGQKVTIAAGSINWNANPFFGSSKAGTNPGETTATLQICGIGGNANTCSTTVGTGTVALTRYKTTSTTTPIVGVLSGAKLTGNIVVGTDAAGCGTCFVRARQNRPVAGQFIQATAPLAIG